MRDDPARTGGEGPRIDGRRRGDIESELREMAPYYADAWEPSEGDVGTTLLTLFSELAEEVTERLDRVPEKHRVSFFDTLGFGRKPPQPARLPLSVTVADRAGRNVTVPAGAQVKASGTDESEQLFEVPSGSAFDATPANLRAIYSLEPEEDAIYRHHRAVDGGAESTALFGPAGGENLQEHAFYIGDAERLSVGKGSKLTVEIDTEAPPPRLHGHLRWEYFGERTIDGETVERWHPFPSQIDVSRSNGTPPLAEELGPLDGVDVPADVANLQEFGGLGAPGERPSVTLPPSAWRQTQTNDSGHAELDFYPDGALTETAVNGVETKWIRATLPPGGPNELFDLRFSSDSTEGDEPPVTVGAASDGPLGPDLLLQNDVPESGNGEIRPFGTQPRLQDTFYLASTDALTKRGAEVTLEFQGTGGVASGDSPVLSWEYFDGSGWSQLDLKRETTDELQQAGEVAFLVPSDLSKTTVAGHEGHWLRVRLVGGDYGEVSFEPTDTTGDDKPDTFERVSTVEPPTFTDITMTYDQTAPPDHTVAENNLDFGPDFAAESVDGYQPFEPVPSEEQALYLGFDGPLTDGPINLLFDLDDVAYPATFHPRIRWEYYDEDTGAWQRLDVRDDTHGLTERGIVSLVFPEPTTSRRALGQDRHWVRARVTGEPFGVTDGDDGEESAEGPSREGPRGRFVETVPPAGEQGRHRPPLRGIHSNAAWVRNRRTIEGEVLGTSDGSVEQTFQIGTRPVVAADVWIDELAVLSEASRQELAEEWPEHTELETDADGRPAAFWVRWTRQPDLLDSGPDDRHFTLDPIEGAVSFGDGTRGMIPPRGSDNVRATYETGGGEAGNVPAGAVSGFRQSLAFVESVTNPIAGAAGADAEATQAVTDRAARQLRDRNRAVAPADIERIAMDASREVARAQCLPGMDPDGRYQPGWVTLLVVPDTAAAKPTPSTTLQETVDAALAEHAPVTLTAVDQLVVRGPSYVSVSVDADLAAAGGSISRLEERAREAVRSYLHPLNGGPAGEGWPVGELPCRSDFFELLEGLEGVDHVGRLALRLETSRSQVTVAEGDEDPDTSEDALAYAGDQEITATLVDAGGGTA